MSQNLLYLKLSFDYKRKAVEFWEVIKQKRKSLKTVQNRFRKVSSETQLRRWAHQISENFKAAIESGLIIYDNELRRCALRAQKLIGYEDRFQASNYWLSKFKNSHIIVIRKINKFVTKQAINKKNKQTRVDSS